MTTATSIYEYARQGLGISPDKTAIWFYGKSMSYRELFSGVDRAAAQLASMGVGQGTVVTIRLPNCPQTIMAVYAIAKLGGISNMVHALLPLDGLRTNMAFTKSSVLITGSHIDDCNNIDFADKIIYVDVSQYMGFAARTVYALKGKTRRPKRTFDFGCSLGSAAAQVVQSKQLTHECALYLHSSGSTGLPKTVMLSHLALNNWVEITRVYFQNVDLTRQVCLSALPYFHALGFQMDMHRVLSCGGTLVIMARWSGKTAVKLIKKRGVTVMAGVPAMCHSLMAQRAFSGPGIKQLQCCFIGGEKMGRSLKRDMDARLDIGDGPCVYEGYGLTETASACAVLGKDHYNIDASGFPRHGVTCMVLGADGTLSETGEGELVVGANCLMMGYLNDPDATEQAFIEWNGLKMLRTGDYGCIDEQGFIYFKERIKNTIVRKGNNIFPCEVETVIKGVKGVADACVIGIPDDSNGTQAVCACIVPDKSAHKDTLEKAVLEECKRFLPAVSLPGKLLWLKELPRNAMNKVDKSKLEELATWKR